MINKLYIGNKGYITFNIKTQNKIAKRLQHFTNYKRQEETNVSGSNRQHCVTKQPKDRIGGTKKQRSIIKSRAEQSSSFYRSLLQKPYNFSKPQIIHKMGELKESCKIYLVSRLGRITKLQGNL